jgi:hypothetical protein
VAFLQDLQSDDELLPELILAQAHEGLRGDRGQRVERHIDTAEPRLPPQMATMMLAGTLYFFWIAASCGPSWFILLGQSRPAC